MESLEQNTQQALTLLIYATLIMLVFITVFLVKLLADLSNLAKSLESLIAVVKHDIGPTMKELKRALININSITKTTTSQFNNLNSAISEGIVAFSNSSKGIPERARIVLSSLKKGILSGLSAFLKK